jgi:hypothetical protein
MRALALKMRALDGLPGATEAVLLSYTVWHCRPTSARAHSREHGRTLAYLEFTHAAPDELASGVVLMTMPDGLQVAGIVVCYNRLIEKGNGSCDPADRSDRRWQTRLAPSRTS